MFAECIVHERNCFYFIGNEEKSTEKMVYKPLINKNLSQTLR